MLFHLSCCYLDGISQRMMLPAEEAEANPQHFLPTPLAVQNKGSHQSVSHSAWRMSSHADDAGLGFFSLCLSLRPTVPRGAQLQEPSRARMKASVGRADKGLDSRPVSCHPAGQL